MAPNGRDYYPEPGRMEKAVAQHRRLMQAINDIQKEIEEEFMAVTINEFAMHACRE